MDLNHVPTKPKMTQTRQLQVKSPPKPKNKLPKYAYLYRTRPSPETWANSGTQPSLMHIRRVGFVGEAFACDLGKSYLIRLQKFWCNSVQHCFRVEGATWLSSIRPGQYMT